MSKPTHISLFSGCGGSSLGCKWAGFETRLAVEWDDHAAATYRANFPTTNLYHGDIAALSVDEALSFASLAPGELDLLDMSPPCQGFSLSGKRQFHDPRNQLFNEGVRLLKGLQPKAFILENVQGLVVGKMKIIFRQIMEELRGCGYMVAAQLLNAKWYHVPQSRPRVIIIGVRNDLGITPSHPLTQSKAIPLKEAWAGLVNTPDDLAPTWIKPSYATAKAAHFLAQGQHPRDSLYSLVRLAWSKPSPCICKTVGESMSQAGPIHPDELRRPTIKELKRIGSFPDDFILNGTFAEQWARIGNSVPPRFMQAIAEHVRGLIQSEATNG